MAYCRWSSDGFRSDLYCYEDFETGWTIHIATNRIVGEVPREDWSLMTSGRPGDVETFARQHQAMMAFVKNAPREEIGLAHDGATFHDHTLRTFRDRLLMLKAAGYRFPADVLPRVEAEMAEREMK